METDELARLQRENRILRKKLFRAEQNLERLETHRARSDRLHQRLLADARENAERLKISEQAANKANKVKGAFLANMSHELRTPLNAIIAYSDLLLEEPSLTGEETIQEDIREIRRAGYHLLRLIESILNFSRIESGHIELNEEGATLGSLVEDAGQLIEPMISQTRCTFVIDIDQDSERIWVDRLRLRQILLNLLTNAVKYTHEGTIRLSASVEGGMAFFRVEDTGQGMPPDVRERIFEAFYQVPAAHQRGGVGLGLTVSAQVCERMGGRILVESQPGEGSRFTVVLPRKLEKLSEKAAR